MGNGYLPNAYGRFAARRSGLAPAVRPAGVGRGLRSSRRVARAGPRHELVTQIIGTQCQQQQAEALARSITDPDGRAWALAAVAGALARAGQHEQARALARSITNPYARARALAAAAGALAQAGQHEQAAAMASRAETVARSITDPDRQARALAAVAGALAQAGQHQQGETVARSITNPDRQAQALTAMAKALVARGDTKQAHHVASAACAVGQWTKVVGLVLSLDPSAIRALTGL
jgi:tetratricopeptide (TPR) repeat protein